MGVWAELSKPETHERLLLHPYQVSIVDIVTSLIAELRSASEREQLRDVQVNLLSALVDAETRYSAQSRLAKRGEGDPTDLLFWRRACAQLRAVGDAVAWRFLDYRREWLLFLGMNESPGLFTGKSGSEVEWHLFNEHWDAGQPTLLTALTSGIRLGDLLVADDGALTVYEVKQREAGFKSGQLRRLERLVRQINEDPRFDIAEGPIWVLESSVGFSSYWTDAEPHMRRALDGGIATWSPTGGVAVQLLAPRYGDMTSEAAVRQRLAEVQAEARVALGETTHRIVSRMHGAPSNPIRTAPAAIYPVPAELAALVVTGEVIPSVELSVDAMAARLRDHGVDAQILLPDAHDELRGETPLLGWRSGQVRGTVHASAMSELLLDLTDLDAWVRALVDAPNPPQPARSFGTYICFANEAAVWA